MGSLGFCGLTPIRPLRSRALNVPNPAIVTSPPFESSRVTSSSNKAMKSSPSFFEICNLSAICVASSALFIFCCHCEEFDDEAILGGDPFRKDCFASLAMTDYFQSFYTTYLAYSITRVSRMMEDPSPACRQAGSAQDDHQRAYSITRVSRIMVTLISPG